MPTAATQVEIADHRNAQTDWWSALRQQFGGSTPQDPSTIKIGRRELIFVLRNLATLVANGISLPKSLSTLARERSLRKHADLLDTLRRKVESGETFSAALKLFPRTFDELTVNQIRVGEKSGTLAHSLGVIATQLEKMHQLRAQVIKRLAYPAVLVVGGFVSVTFMLLFVIPVFQQTYNDAKVPLPMITQFMIAASDWVTKYGWVSVFVMVMAVLAYRQSRRNPRLACSFDKFTLKIPVLGPWFRDLAVLQFIDVLGNLLESGFTVVEALGVSAGSVTNRAVRKSVEELQAAVTRGERFSRELDRQGDLFPPVVTQLVIVGEKTGSLANSMAHIRDHLRREIERTTNILVGTIEPVLTITLALSIGTILLAVYLPMFDMIGAMNTQH